MNRSGEVILRDPNKGEFWCDKIRIDFDLFKVAPRAKEILAPVAEVLMRTHCEPTDGRINCPSAWNTDLGLTAFFGFTGEPRPSDYYYTSSPIVECTFEEAVRDCYAHCLNMAVTSPSMRPALVFCGGSPEMRDAEQRLLYFIRGWDQNTRTAVRARRLVERQLAIAVSQFMPICLVNKIPIKSYETSSGSAVRNSN